MVSLEEQAISGQDTWVKSSAGGRLMPPSYGRILEEMRDETN